jgi:hypothetical protein
MPRLFVLLLAACSAVEPLPATGTESVETLSSTVLEDDLVLRIRLPDTTDPGPFPVVFQLDPTFAGLNQYAHTTGLVSQREADGDWPPVVVVGLDYDDPGKRFRDYTYDDYDDLDPAFPTDVEGPDRFYAALRDEVLPHVDATLPIDPAQRILQGHSNGGVFSWYAALRHDPAEGPLFSAHVAADNGYGQELFTLERWHAERSDDLPIRLYASRATANGPTHSLSAEGFYERIRDRDYPGFDFMTEVLDTDHGGAVVPSFDNGLAFALGVSR